MYQKARLAGLFAFLAQAGLQRDNLSSNFSDSDQ
jgi:hypothetical protein